MNSTRWSRCSLGFVFAALVTLVALLVPSSAFAAGSVIAKSTQLDENDGKWKLELTIDLGSMPDINFVPMNFVFTPTAYDELACDEQHDKPFHNRKPLVNQSPISIPTDVGFSDGMGKGHQKTKYVFVIRRDDRFEAGEYTLDVQKDGRTVGAKMTLTLKGENRVVDRRPMTIGAAHPKDDPCQPHAQTASATSDKPASGDDSKDAGKTDSGAGDKSAASGSGDSGSADPNASSGEVPPAKGCKCMGAGLSLGGTEGAAIVGLASVVALGLRRRRKG